MPLVETALLEEAREEAKEEARRKKCEGKKEIDGAQCYERAARYVIEMAEHLKPLIESKA